MEEKMHNQSQGVVRRNMYYYNTCIRIYYSYIWQDASPAFYSCYGSQHVCEATAEQLRESASSCSASHLTR